MTEPKSPHPPHVLQLAWWGQHRWGLLSLLYLGIFLAIMALAYTNTLPPQLGRIPYYDKIGHCVLYAIAAYLGHRILRRRWIRLLGRSLPLFALGFSSFTVVEELVQNLSPYRTLDLSDLLWSFVGIVLGTWLAQRSAHPSP
jgi:VanZ family protein